MKGDVPRVLLIGVLLENFMNIFGKFFGRVEKFPPMDGSTKGRPLVVINGDITLLIGVMTCINQWTASLNGVQKQL